MLYSRSCCILSALILFVSPVSFADSVADEFTKCASFVLRDKSSEKAVYQVDLTDLESEAPHESAVNKAKELSFVGLEMELTNAVTGEKIGDVRCYLTNTGQLLGAEFVKIYSPLAAN